MPVQEADELDPFRASVISDDEEVVLENQGRTQTHMRVGSGGGGEGGGGGKKKKEVYIYPSTAGDHIVGHRRIGSAGTTAREGRGEDRMMTSAEMNMKSQFLMNLRPFGQESARSEGSGTTTASGVVGGASRLEMNDDKEGMLSEEEDERAPVDDNDDDDDDEELGPGSDFFR